MGTKSTQRDQTVVWGPELEAEHYLKVPKVLFSLGLYGANAKLQPRHVLLVLALAARRFQKRPLQYYWETLATQMGVRPDTLRRWAYELKEMGLLRITPNRGRDPTKGPGVRNDKNTFDIGPFAEFLLKAEKKRRAARSKRSEAKEEAA